MANSTGSVYLRGVVEGLTDEAVVRRLIAEAGAEVDTIYVQNGKSNLLRNLPGFNNAARFSPWLVLTDLDNDAPCAPAFVKATLPKPADQMCFRVALRAVEAWFLADRSALAQFLGVRVATIPSQPEEVDDPKRTVVDLANKSRRRQIRDDIVPRPGSGRNVGPGYVARMLEFGTRHWSPERAAGVSDSLDRCRRSIAGSVAAEVNRICELTGPSDTQAGSDPSLGHGRY
jgi:hypothetical protein